MLTNVILVDEHPIVMEALAQRLTAAGGFEVIAQLTHSDKAFFEILDRAPGMVIMELELAGRGAIDVADQIAARLPKTKIVFLTSFDTDIFIDVAVRLGVAGFLLKTEPVNRIVESLLRIRDGETVYSPSIQERLQVDGESKQLQVK